MDFDIAKAKAIPGDGTFWPTLEWSEAVLQVPVKELLCKQLGGGGASGASFFKCDASYSGSTLNPNLGLPTKMFIKMRNPRQPVDEFDPETTVDALAKYLPRPPPLARLLSADRNYLMMENLGTPYTPGCNSDDAEEHPLLDSLAQFHGAFWGLAKAPGLRSQQAWMSLLAGQRLPLEQQLRLLDEDGGLPPVPEPGRGLFRRALEEIGVHRMIDHINTFGTTVVHGDAHEGQFLCLHKETEGGKRVGIIDFGWAHLGNPAIDIGALMMKQPDHVAFVKYYYNQLIAHTGCAESGSSNPHKLPSCSVDDFVRLCRVAAGIRNLFMRSFGGWDTEGFELFDQATFEHLAEHTRTDVIGSSLLSFSSESPARPPQSVIDALSTRESHRYHTKKP
jgi:hypothetical protein